MDIQEDRRRALFAQFLQCLDREENLIHYRMNWGFQWNVGVSAAVVALYNLPNTSPVVPGTMLFLAIFGATAGFLSFIGVKAAHKQSAFLIEEIRSRLNIVDDNWDDSEFIRPFGDWKIHPRARWVSAFFPLMSTMFWILAFFYILKERVIPPCSAGTTSSCLFVNWLDSWLRLVF